MHWWIAEWLCALPEVGWYDLGGADGDCGLHQFKKGFSGKLGAIVETPPTYNFSRSRVDNLLGQSIYKMRDLKALLSGILHQAKFRFTG